MKYLFFVMPWFEKEGELRQGFQTFLYIFKSQGMKHLCNRI